MSEGEVQPTAAIGPGTDTCAGLLDALLTPVWLVDSARLRIVAANEAAGRMFGAAAAELVGRPVLELAATPEDHAFWRCAGTLEDGTLESDSLVRRTDGATRAVTRRVSRVKIGSAAGLYLVCMVDRECELGREREMEHSIGELQATLESLIDGVLVTDLHGRIRHFNQRFAELWEVPPELLRVRTEDAVLGWMQDQVIDPSRYVRRLAAINDTALLRTSDVIALQGGQMFERVAVPQYSRGRLIGRVFTFREIRRTAPEARPVG